MIVLFEEKLDTQQLLVGEDIGHGAERKTELVAGGT